MNRTQTDEATGRAAAQIRPALSADLAALSGFFAGLSPRTRLLRFFAPITPTPAMLARLAGRAGNTDAVIAVTGGLIIGHAMAADQGVSCGDPVTDIGVVVADAWQGRGVGSALMRALITRAQARGVRHMSMDVLPGNRQVLAMIASHWAEVRTEQSPDCVTLGVLLPQDQRSLLRPASSAPVPAA